MTRSPVPQLSDEERAALEPVLRWLAALVLRLARAEMPPDSVLQLSPSDDHSAP